MLYLLYFSDPTCGACIAAKPGAEIAANQLKAPFLYYANSWSIDKTDFEKYAGSDRSLPRIVVKDEAGTVYYNRPGGASSQDIVNAVQPAHPTGALLGPTTGYELPTAVVTASKVKSWFSRNWPLLLFLLIGGVVLYFAYKAMRSPKKGDAAKPSDATQAWRDKVKAHANSEGISYKEAMVALKKTAA